MKKALLRLTLLVAVIVVAVSTWAALEGHRRFTGPGPLAEPATVVIPKGAGLGAIARRLVEAGIVRDVYSFQIGVRMRGVTLRAGEYGFSARISAEDAMRQMAEGRTIVHRLTIAEGLTVKQVADLVAKADFLAGEVGKLPPEGWLLPETWHLSRGDDRGELMDRMEKAMRQELEQAWEKRDRGLPLKNPIEALVLASVVERETGLAAERPKVAAVFLNRIRLGMRLQSDPTVIYGLSDGAGFLDRPLTRADLEKSHRWNTYAIDGLPATPIANPGKASIEAVLHPAATDALYFVADGSGGHVFAKSLDEHNRNVAGWRRVERERKAGKK